MARIVEWRPTASCPLDVVEYLTVHGIYYEHWDLAGLPDRLRRGWNLDGRERIAVIEALSAPLSRMAEAFHTISYDLVLLAPELTPALDDALSPSRLPHHHSEAEIRLVVDGEADYTLTANGATFTVTLEPGDLIAIPAGVRHAFELTSLRRLKAVRLFQSPEGWIARFDPAEVEVPAR
ncbi:MAG: cupin domain-containing protein [Firmicutes bacterium]|nr:cupin domain-containing protein [Alicyclobacillaceae bacterium]MCL6498056.1 cupin domain-containing protein [Bacillota bacterium]